jgi:DNA end-binding protein Ku
VAPDKAARKPYALLARAMEEEGKVAIARFVMRTKQYLAALRPKDGVLVLSTMVYADEVNDGKELGELDGIEDVDVSDRELRMASQLIESLSEPFHADDFQDEHRHQVLELVERKAAGEEELVPAPAPVAEERVVDLMAALEASVKEAKAARGRHPATPTASTGGADDADGETAATSGSGGGAATKTKAKPRAKTAKRKSA